VHCWADLQSVLALALCLILFCQQYSVVAGQMTSALTSEVVADSVSHSMPAPRYTWATNWGLCPLFFWGGGGAGSPSIDNRKKLVKQQYLPTCLYNMGNFSPPAAEISSLVWGTPANFNGFRVLAALVHSTLLVDCR